MKLSRRRLSASTAVALADTITAERGRGERLAINADDAELGFLGATDDPVRVKMQAQDRKYGTTHQR